MVAAEVILIFALVVEKIEARLFGTDTKLKFEL
jgi:hypothetical protein